jgi:hypothetical protein
LATQNPSQQRAGGVVQGIGPEFKPQYCKKKEKRKNNFSSSLSQPLVISDLPVSMNLPILRMTYKWNHVVLVLFISHSIFKKFLC